MKTLEGLNVAGLKVLGQKPKRKEAPNRRHPTHPGCFAERVQKMMKIEELTFQGVRKSL
jgi:hypothetical protein